VLSESFFDVGWLMIVVSTHPINPPQASASEVKASRIVCRVSEINHGPTFAIRYPTTRATLAMPVEQ